MWKSWPCLLALGSCRRRYRGCGGTRMGTGWWKYLGLVNLEVGDGREGVVER